MDSIADIHISLNVLWISDNIFDFKIRVDVIGYNIMVFLIMEKEL